MINGGQEVFI